MQVITVMKFRTIVINSPLSNFHMNENPINIYADLISDGFENLIFNSDENLIFKSDKKTPHLQ